MDISSEEQERQELETFRDYQDHEEQNCEKIALRIITMLDKYHDKIDQKTTIFTRDCNLSISLLLSKNSERLFDHLGEKIDLGFPCHIPHNPIDNMNNIIFLMHKYILTIMHQDGHKSIRQAIQSSTKYLSCRKVLDKYMLLYSNDQRYRQYIFDHYKDIVQDKHVNLFRQFIAVQSLSNITIPMIVPTVGN